LDIAVSKAHPYIPTGRRSISCGGNAMKKMTVLNPFAGFQLDQTRHDCAFFNNADEEYRVLLPFIKKWIDAN
jgi:hypothetical protein